MRMPCPRWRGSMNFSSLLSDYSVRTMSAVVMRRAAAVEAGLLDPAFTRCEDIDFFLRVALLRPNNILAVPQVLNLYRRHAGQRTCEWSKIRDGWNELLEKMRGLAPAETGRVERIASSNMYRYSLFWRMWVVIFVRQRHWPHAVSLSRAARFFWMHATGK